jgi:hypothetical protein
MESNVHPQSAKMEFCVGFADLLPGMYRVCMCGVGGDAVALQFMWIPLSCSIHGLHFRGLRPRQGSEVLLAKV